MFLKLYALTLPIFFTLDIIWLGLISKNFYKEQIGFLLKSQVNWYAAIAFYLLFVAGLVVFVISPAVSKHLWQFAVLYGLLFGLVTYAAYDLTNLAMTNNWPLLVTIVDLVWGAVLSSSVALVSYLLANKIGI